MKLWYTKEPLKYIEDTTGRGFGNKDWEHQSLPLGNGYLGACVLGYTDTERVQITENSLCNPYRPGLSGFAELYIDFNHQNATDYVRTLSLDGAIATVSYTVGGTHYKREYFTSYPDKVLVMRFSADTVGGVSLCLRPEIPYIDDFCVERGDGMGKSGTVRAEGDTVTLEGRMHYYDIPFEGQIKVIPTGAFPRAVGERIYVDGADEVVMIFACATSYKLESRVFLEPDPKKKLAPYPHPHGEVTARISAAADKSFGELYERHLSDYRQLYSRVTLTLGEEDDITPTDELLEKYKKGKESRYLESLLYQYGRYLLIASSRKGCLPANLQGVWNVHRASPWSSGYWHNINVQMNYWPSEVANLAETFLSYSDYAMAYMAAARDNADRSVAASYPDKLTERGTNGWIIGTGGWPYKIEGFDKIGHSGPGTGAITSLLFWDYYDYTRDVDFLRDIGYPVLREMSLFLSKTLVEKDGKLLVCPSASPEIMVNGQYHHTVGCAFDQEMVYENHKRTLEAAEILGISDDFTDLLRYQLTRLDPVIIGKNGQVKEFREEEYYGEIGEYKHRHISQLFGLYPGTLINSTTEEWLRAAEVTLTERGDKSHGWATAHRLCLWARTRRADKTMALIRSMLCNNILPNLWDSHPPFQIDGNLGYTAGVSELLLQSQAGYIDLLPALPDEWESGSFTGLVARGNFTVDCAWRNKRPASVGIRSRSGGVLAIRCEGTPRLSLNGVSLSPRVDADGILRIITKKGDLTVLRFS